MGCGDPMVCGDPVLCSDLGGGDPMGDRASAAAIPWAMATPWAVPVPWAVAIPRAAALAFGSDEALAFCALVYTRCGFVRSSTAHVPLAYRPSAVYVPPMCHAHAARVLAAELPVLCRTCPMTTAFSSNLTDVATSVTNFDQSCSKFDRCWQTLSEISLTLAKVGQISTELDPLWPSLDQVRPSLVKIGRTSARVGPLLTVCGRIGPKLAEFRSHLAELWPNLGRFSVKCFDVFCFSDRPCFLRVGPANYLALAVTDS